MFISRGELDSRKTYIYITQNYYRLQHQKSVKHRFFSHSDTFRETEVGISDSQKNTGSLSLSLCKNDTLTLSLPCFPHRHSEKTTNRSAKFEISQAFAPLRMST